MATEPPPPPEPLPPPPPPPAAAPPRDEMNAAPPFASWRVIHAVVLIALGAQVVLYAALTAIYR
ncbi:MAG TPA: hypothetical protein VFH68_24290 [Polyangia bacterium]|nr:hypothetical protein [Polyangia bacterium]